jgi:hypothetical protein
MKTPRSVTGAFDVGRDRRLLAVLVVFAAAVLVAVDFAVVFAAVVLVVLDAVLVVFAAAVLVAVDFAAAVLGAAAFVDRVAFGAGATVSAAGVVVAALEASERVVFDSAARALPAAVCAPLALVALPAAMRALAAFVAAALPVDLATCALVTTAEPPMAALTFLAIRLLRRAAAFGWMAPALAATASLIVAATSTPSGWAVATVTALATRVFAADRRGCRMACRRSAWRTRFSPDGLRAPCHFRGVLAKVADLRSVGTCFSARGRSLPQARRRMVAELPT